MKPEDFARQFFDLWQDSFSNAMGDPTFNVKLLHLMEQSNVLWNNNEKKDNQHQNKKILIETAPIQNGTSYKQPTRPNDHRDGTISQLASRVEKCEQRIQVLETIIRSQLSEISEYRESRSQRERNARIEISKGVG